MGSSGSVCPADNFTSVVPSRKSTVAPSVLNDVLQSSTAETIDDIKRLYRDKLRKEGRRQLDEFIKHSAKLKNVERIVSLRLKVAELQIAFPIPAIRFISFEKFSERGKLPHSPGDDNLATELQCIDRDNAFLVFISHCWLRGWNGAEGWDGQPHPDNAAGDKFQLCVNGIRSLWATYAPRMRDCYVWLDFGCINQDGNPAAELEQLDKIMQYCDCVFTPIVALFDASESLSAYSDHNVAYKAKLWHEGPHAYLNRAWCRVEMLYAANIPLLVNANSSVKRHTMFEADLAYHCKDNRRPHFLYGTKEYAENVPPLLLPALQQSYLTKYHPAKGSLSVASDKQYIETLMSELQPYLDANTFEVGYKGDKNAAGEKHGHGTLRSTNGDVYEGEWKNDKKHGDGTYRYANGEVYKGHWRENYRDGHGTLYFVSGGSYEGEWRNDKQHGHAVVTFGNGERFEGEYIEGRRSGGEMYADNSVYVGYTQKHKRRASL